MKIESKDLIELIEELIEDSEENEEAEPAWGPFQRTAKRSFWKGYRRGLRQLSDAIRLISGD